MRIILVVLVSVLLHSCVDLVFFFQAEDGIRDLVRSRGLGDVYKRQIQMLAAIQLQEHFLLQILEALT